MKADSIKKLTPNTPIIVGVGFDEDRSLDPTQCPEAYQLMVRAVRRAADDAGSAALVNQIESISVPQGMWQYRNPGKLLADALGCPSARSILAHFGILQLQLLSDLCRAIVAGEQHVGVITGGEAKFREVRAKITQQSVWNTEEPADAPAPDAYLMSPDPFCSELESLRGMRSPVEFFAIIESAIRYRQRLGLEEHRDRIARLYSGFSEIAARNPHAWDREPVAADVIRNPSPQNPMQAFPYNKLHCSQWNVNRGVAIFVCSAAKAASLGLDRARWIYPLSATQSKHVVAMAQRTELDSCRGSVLCGERALELAATTIDDITEAELYSCFPSAIQSFAHDLKLEGRCPWTVTGAMPFAGGPLNQFSLEGIARMVEVLRPGDGTETSGRRIGLVSNLSGIFGKQACALFSNVSSAAGYRFEDVTDAVARVDAPVPLNGDYTGPATVVGYTVAFAGGNPSRAIAVCDIPGGARTVATNEDRELMERMMREEYCGCVVQISDGGLFS